MKNIVITGAAGFIGSCMVQKMNEENCQQLILVDDFSRSDKKGNWENKQYIELVDRKIFFDWLDKNHQDIDFIVHLGARTDTAEFDQVLLNELNLEYSQKMWDACVRFNIPLIYASSGATYGNGELGYDDDIKLSARLHPLNPYGLSKNNFDIWVDQQPVQPPFWAGLKFFNVYGPNEYHKSRMASVVFHSFRQIKANAQVKLFRSHNPNYKDGMQLRDFIYVKDVVNVIYFLMNKRPASDIYNLGTGHARAFMDLAKATFKAMNIVENIEFVDTPVDIRDKYQYFTEAKMDKLRAAGYDKPFTSLEDGVNDYVVNYLMQNKIY